MGPSQAALTPLEEKQGAICWDYLPKEEPVVEVAQDLPTGLGRCLIETWRAVADTHNSAITHSSCNTCSHTYFLNCLCLLPYKKYHQLSLKSDKGMSLSAWELEQAFILTLSSHLCKSECLIFL